MSNFENLKKTIKKWNYFSTLNKFLYFFNFRIYWYYFFFEKLLYQNLNENAKWHIFISLVFVYSLLYKLYIMCRNVLIFMIRELSEYEKWTLEILFWSSYKYIIKYAYADDYDVFEKIRQKILNKPFLLHYKVLLYYINCLSFIIFHYQKMKVLR